MLHDPVPRASRVSSKIKHMPLSALRIHVPGVPSGLIATLDKREPAAEGDHCCGCLFLASG